MWARKAVAAGERVGGSFLSQRNIERRNEHSLPCQSDMSDEELHSVSRKDLRSFRRRLRGASFDTPQNTSISLAAPQQATDSRPLEQRNMQPAGLVDDHRCSVTESGGREAARRMRGRMMLSARRWTSRNKVSDLAASSASESPGTADDSQLGESSAMCPNPGARRKYNSTNTCVTAPTNSENSENNTGRARLAQRIRRRRSLPLRDQLLRCPPPPPLADHPSPSSPAAGADSTTPTTHLTEHRSTSPNLPSLLNPDRMVASSYLAAADNDKILSSSPATSTASEAPGWAERACLAAGVRSGAQGPATCSILPSNSDLDGDKNSSKFVRRRERDVPRFLRPVILLLTLSMSAIIGAKIGGGGWEGFFDVYFLGPAVYAAGGSQLPEAVVDDIFDRADKDNDGVIAEEEIQYLVEGAGGTLLDDESEIAAGVASVIKHLDLNDDDALSRSDLLTYWKRLGTLLTVDEVAEWVVHAAQLPQEVADTFRSNMVTGYDFPELAAKQGVLLEQDLGVTRPAFRKRLVRSMKWKLWGMGEEPAPARNFRATNASCGTMSLEWDRSEGESNLSFPIHKFVLRRTQLEADGRRESAMGAASAAGTEWTTVMEGSNRVFFDSRLKPGARYRYSLRAWNALGHSSAVEIDVLVATDDCVTLPHGYWWLGGGGLDSFRAMLGALLVVFFTVFYIAGCSFFGGSKKRRTDDGSYEGVWSKNDSFSSNDARKHSDGLSDGRSAGTFPRMISGSMSSPMSSAGKGGGWSDRDVHQYENADKPEPSRILSNNNSTRLGRLPRAASGPLKSRPGKGKGGTEVVTGTMLPSGGRDPRPEVTVAVESMRREAARRLMTKQSNSIEEKDLCGLCGREFKWFNRRGKHTCCKCHELFCDKCGVVSHSFWACPVGGSCMCSNCVGGGARRHSSH